MTAKDYPISFPYGATSAPYSPSRPHRGNDRAAPQGTPVVIEGVTIGLVGSTGWSTGAHLHTQAGTDKACQNTFNPSPLEFKAGTVVNAGFGDQWGKFVTIQVGSQYITYCHLSEIGVKIGQVIKEANVGKITSAEVGKAYQLDGRTASAADKLLHSSKGTVDSVLSGLIRDSATKGNQKKINDLTAQVKAKDAEIAALKLKIKELESRPTGEFVPAGELYVKK